MKTVKKNDQVVMVGINIESFSVSKTRCMPSLVATIARKGMSHGSLFGECLLAFIKCFWIGPTSFGKLNSRGILLRMFACMCIEELEKTRQRWDDGSEF